MRAENFYESAADELKKKLPSLRKIDYSTIDNLMQRISKRYKITGKKLHDLFVSKYGHTPDTWIKKYKEKLGEEGVAEGSLNEFVPPEGSNNDDRNRRLRKLLEIAIKVAEENNVGTLGMVHAMNTIASDDFFRVAVEGILPDITDREYTFIIQSAYKTVKQGNVDEGQVVPFKQKNPLTPNLIKQLKALSQQALELFWEGSYMPTAAQGQVAQLSQEEQNRMFKQNEANFKSLGYQYSMNEEESDILYLHSIAREQWYEADKPANQYRGLPDLMYNQETNTLSYYDLIGDDGYEYTDNTQFEDLMEKPLDENLHQWFKEKWVRFGPDGKIRGDCARGSDSEGKPKCLPQSKAHSLGKKGRKYAAAKKRREDPNPERRGPAKNVATKKKSNEGLENSNGKLLPYDIAISLHTIKPEIFKRFNEDLIIDLIDKSIKSNPNGHPFEIMADVITKLTHAMKQGVAEQWSQKYKSSINCSHPKGFSQKAHCAGKKKHNESIEMEMTCPDCGMCETHCDHENLDEACWKGYHKEGNKKMFGKTYPNCVKNEDIQEEKCPHCNGPMFSELMINEKKDACYYKVKSRYKVWPSAYASGALVKCRKKGADSWGNKSESISEEMNLEELFDMKMNELLNEKENWAKHNNPRAGGMSQKSVKSYRRSHPGSKIQTAVTTKPSKLKKGSKSAKRRASFCARMRGMKKHRTGAKTARDPNSNINKSLRRWNCESVEDMKNLIMIAEQKIAEAKNLKQQAAIAIAKKKKMNENSNVEYILYANDKPAAKYINLDRAKIDLNHLQKKFKNQKFEIKQEVCKTEPVNISQNIFNEGEVIPFTKNQQLIAPQKKSSVSPLQKRKKLTQRTDNQNVVPIDKKPAGLTWNKLPKDVLKLANDWFWADMEDTGSAAVLDPKGYGSGTRNDLQFITAQLQQRGWKIDYDDNMNVLLTNKAGQSVLLPSDDAYDFKGWAAGTNSDLRESVEQKDDVQQIKEFIKWSMITLNMQKPYPKFTLSRDTKQAQEGHHTGVHTGDRIWVYIENRNLVDIFRTIFHELVHHRQDQLGMIKHGDSYPGSPIEALADMMAGKYIKIYGKEHSEIFQ